MVERRIINPWNWQDRYGFVQANEISNVNKTLLCSGQTAIDAEGKAAYPNDIGAQLKMALDNLEEVLRKAALRIHIASCSSNAGITMSV
jgi:enamine deaminase RidA (YjgF/YER057c/UK114 family)